MAQLIDWLSGRGLTPVTTPRPAVEERREIGWLSSLLQRPRSDLSGRLTLKQLGALSARTVCYVGIDSVPMHIAAAVGTPVVALFGPSSETLWAPRRERELVILQNLLCRLPCNNKQESQTIECLTTLTPAVVQSQMDLFLRCLGF